MYSLQVSPSGLSLSGSQPTWMLTPALLPPPPPLLQVLESPVYSVHTWFNETSEWQLGQRAAAACHNPHSSVQRSHRRHAVRCSAAPGGAGMLTCAGIARCPACTHNPHALVCLLRHSPVAPHQACG